MRVYGASVRLRIGRRQAASGDGSVRIAARLESGLLEEGAETPGCVFVASSKIKQEARKVATKI